MGSELFLYFTQWEVQYTVAFFDPWESAMNNINMDIFGKMWITWILKYTMNVFPVAKKKVHVEKTVLF